MLARSLLAVLVSATAGAGTQRDVFTKPVRLAYGDKATIAPMMAPCLTLDWDRDGRADLVGGGTWWRNTGETRDGLTVFERGGGGAISASMVGDLDGDGFGDFVSASKRPDGYTWFEETTAKGPRRFETRGMLAWAIGGNLVIPERGEGAPGCWLADWDGDGRTDVLAGTRAVGLERYLPRTGPGFGVGWRDGTWLFRDMTATVWLHRNVGTKAKPVFSAGSLVTTGATGRAITFFDRAEPAAVDWDGDGKLDLVVCAFDRVAVFLHVGKAKGTPQLDDVVRVEDDYSR